MEQTGAGKQRFAGGPSRTRTTPNPPCERIYFIEMSHPPGELPSRVDVALVGGGLANGLIALRLSALRPEIALVLLEKGSSLGGRHVWSFHDSDLTPSQRGWIEPLVARSWPHYEVRFPGLRRRMESGYNSITSGRFHQVLERTLGHRARLRCEVESIEPSSVRLADGRSIEASVVIDGRGWRGGAFELAYQKFVGLHLRLAAPHDLGGPILMDATVEQIDGFRFLYTLPLSPTDLLVEDTRYSDDPVLDLASTRRAIERYAAAMGWHPQGVTDEEHGVLPIVLDGDMERHWASTETRVPMAGLRAALFHPTTGYSLPDAVRLAERIAASDSLSSRELFDMIRSHSIACWKRGGYLRFLNRMLFRACAPEDRWRVMERFYRLPEGLIERFYADRLTVRDRLRLLAGKPPVSPIRALACLPGAGALGRS